MICRLFAQNNVWRIFNSILKMDDYIQIVRFASYFSVLIPLIAYFIKIRTVSSQIHSIGVLVIVSCVCDTVGFILAKQNLSTALIVNVFVLLQFFLLSYYYYKTLFFHKPNAVLIVGMVQYTLAFLLLVFFYEAFQSNHQNFVWLASGVILLAYSVSSFMKMFRTHESPPAIYTYGNFWINSAILVYMGASLWLFAFRTSALVEKIDADMDWLLWSFHNINNVIKNILFALGFYFSSKDV